VLPDLRRQTWNRSKQRGEWFTFKKVCCLHLKPHFFFSFESRRNPKKPALVLEDIRATTIDELVFNDMNGDPPDILAIDTEGYDFECLQGAERVLATGKVHYIEFEFHKKGPWLHTKLEKAITFLNAYSYECYLAQPALVRLTGCWPWNKFGDRHAWSNVVCALRDDPCWSTALQQCAYMQGFRS